MNTLQALVSRFMSSSASIDDQLFIDAGSSNTRIYLGERLVFAEPTCVAVHGPSDTVVAIGTKAQKLLGKTAKNITVSFPVQHGVVAAPSYMEVFLTTVLKRIMADFSLKRTIFGVKVWYAVPAEASPVDTQFIEEILGQVGFSQVVLVPSIAAAYHQVVSQGSSTQGYCIVDIGGQTTEAGVVSADSLVKGQTFKWGGVQFTEAIQELIRTEHQCAVGWHIAEEVKKDIGRIPSQGDTEEKAAKTAVRGKDVITQVSKTAVVSSAIFDDRFQVLVTELHSSLETFFGLLPSELTTNVLDQGIYLTGGFSQFDGLGEALSHKLNAAVHHSQDPTKDTIKGLVQYAKSKTV